ncbi:hypothetical protein YC2023_089845 [Brassica napus]
MVNSSLLLSDFKFVADGVFFAELNGVVLPLASIVFNAVVLPLARLAMIMAKIPAMFGVFDKEMTKLTNKEFVVLALKELPNGGEDELLPLKSLLARSVFQIRVTLYNFTPNHRTFSVSTITEDLITDNQADVCNHAGESLVFPAFMYTSLSEAAENILPSSEGARGLTASSSGVAVVGKKFVADGVFFAELNGVVLPLASIVFNAVVLPLARLAMIMAKIPAMFGVFDKEMTKLTNKEFVVLALKELPNGGEDELLPLKSLLARSVFQIRVTLYNFTPNHRTFSVSTITEDLITDNQADVCNHAGESLVFPAFMYTSLSEAAENILPSSEGARGLTASSSGVAVVGKKV